MNAAKAGCCSLHADVRHLKCVWDRTAVWASVFLWHAPFPISCDHLNLPCNSKMHVQNIGSEWKHGAVETELARYEIKNTKENAISRQTADLTCIRMPNSDPHLSVYPPPHSADLHHASVWRVLQLVRENHPCTSVSSLLQFKGKQRRTTLRIRNRYKHNCNTENTTSKTRTKRFNTVFKNSNAKTARARAGPSAMIPNTANRINCLRIWSLQLMHFTLYFARKLAASRILHHYVLRRAQCI